MPIDSTIFEQGNVSGLPEVHLFKDSRPHPISNGTCAEVACRTGSWHKRYTNDAKLVTCERCKLTSDYIHHWSLR